MGENRIVLLKEDDISKAFGKIETLLSTQKARECLKRAEEQFAFDAEIVLHPIRQVLAECLELVASLVRERGTAGKDLDSLVPQLAKWLEPGSRFSQEIARLEKEIAEKKRKHPDFILAMKLQILVKRFEEAMNTSQSGSIEYDAMQKKYENAKATLADHMQTKIRIAQRAFAPDVLEVAQIQIELARHHEKILLLKKELLDAGITHTRNTLQNLAGVFKDVEPEVADTILTQTQSLTSIGDLPRSPQQKEPPRTLDEYRKELMAQNQRILSFHEKLRDCMQKLQEVFEFEEAIFNTYGEQLRERGVQFKKTLKPEKHGVGMGVKKQPASRMVGRRGQNG
ncbi:MAG: hypothetical protein C4527_24605 [Candidatus Omnitrophota bacterium]|jgi:hypothetical protein|nr:MAG: hypothetical protein C4527_24605 [Candidatus Omnitrophota bacterium]